MKSMNTQFAPELVQGDAAMVNASMSQVEMTVWLCSRALCSHCSPWSANKFASHRELMKGMIEMAFGKNGAHKAEPQVPGVSVAGGAAVRAGVPVLEVNHVEKAATT